MNPLRILLADDHALVRACLRALLAEMGMEVVAEAGDGQEALRLIAETRPDLALVDISMPGLNGLEVAARACKEHPATRVVMLSMHINDEFVRRAVAAGAVGYLLKNADRRELELALRAVSQGQTWWSAEISRGAAAASAEDAPPASADSVYEVLTSRQREVLQLIAEGLSSKGIANRLEVAVKTVETHRTELMERLGIHGVAGLVRYAIRVGLVNPS
jgi:DNA-binding NarL/FixJ family response regulator